MTPRSPNLNELILSIHSAALAEDSWISIGNELCRAFGADGASLVRPSAKADRKPWCRLFEFDPAFMKEYADQWGQFDVWYAGAVRTRRISVGLVNVDSQLIEYQEYKRTVFYNEFLKRMNIDRMMNVCLAAAEPGASYGTTALSFYRGKGKEAFSSQEAGLFSHLAPHLAVAAQNHGTAQALRLLANAQGNALDALTSAVFGLECSGRIAFTNRIGDELLRQKLWLQSSDGSLGAAGSAPEHAVLAQALRQLGAGLAFKTIITDRATGTQAIVGGAPIPASMASPYPPSVTALVWVTSILPDAHAAADLAMLCGLTEAERRLVGCLIAGADLRDAAARLHISPHTARTQLKSIFAKTGRRTQAALLAFVARLSTLRMVPSGNGRP